MRDHPPVLTAPTAVRTALWVCFLLGTGCATAAIATPPPRTDDAADDADGAAPATPAPDAQAEDAAPPSSPLTRRMSPPLPEQVNGGTIARPALLSLLSAGIPHFLRRVEVEPVRPAGRFVGWRLITLFPDDPTLQDVSVIQPGDVVLRVNSHSIERPEQFKTVWDSLAAGGEIVFDIVRGDQPSRVRYQINDDNLGTTDEPVPVATEP